MPAGGITMTAGAVKGRGAFIAGVLALLGLLLAALLPGAAGGAELTLKDGRPFCEAYPCDKLLPDADAFRAAEGLSLPVLEALRDGEPYAYLFLSVDLVTVPGYSGKPLVTLIAMDLEGTILGATVVHHAEPILLVGIPERVLDEYLARYIGANILDEDIGEPPEDEEAEEHGEAARERGERDDHGVPGLVLGERAREREEADEDEDRAVTRGEREGHDEREAGEHEEERGLRGPDPEEARDRLKAAGGEEPPPNVYMITGATVTALMLDETLLASSREVARAVGLLGSQGRREITWHAEYEPKTWDELVAEGSVGHLRVEPEEMGAEPRGDRPWIDLYFGDLTQPVTGINLLGRRTYEWLQETLKEGEKAIFVASNGISSFKGSGFVRGGIFDRFHLEQGLNKFNFHDLDYEHLYGIEAEGAPEFKESGLFFLRDTRFDSTLPWTFVYLGSRLTGETATSKAFRTFETGYRLPEKYYDVEVTAAADAGPSDGSAVLARIWSGRQLEVGVLAAFLLAVMGVFFARRWVRASARRLEVVHVTVLIASVVVVGIYLRTPPSVVQLFPLAHTYQEGFRWNLFLADPLLFVFWIFIAVSLLLWGRGWFCGWVCPYGSLLELVHRFGRKVLPKKANLNFPPRVHNVLRRLRYVILAVLVGLSLYSVEAAERLAEVEPFKTTWIVGVFERDWYLILYWWVLLGVSIFVFRFFCRYLCPLGAALSIGTALRLIGIKRKEFCTRCKICARGCDSLAIDDHGDINKYECLYCMECEQKYHDDRICPPLVIARRKAERESAARETGRSAPPGTAGNSAGSNAHNAGTAAGGGT